MTAIAFPIAAAPARARLVSRPLLLRFASIVCASVGFYLPLAVTPLFAAASGAQANAGFATGALLLATVAAELATPRIVAQIGYRWALAVGLVLLGAPALVLTWCSSLPAIIVVSTVRGVGFALTVVAGGALTATLIPDERRGEGLAVVGLVSGIPSLVALPAGIWVAHRWGFDAVFVVTAIAPLLAVVTLPGLPGRDSAERESHGIVSGLRDRALNRPAVVFTAVTAAAGVVVTFVPLAVASTSPWLASAALFVQAAVSTASRWMIGRVGDRIGQVRLLVPGLGLSIIGMASLAATSSAVLVLAGAAAFGAGFGLVQNSTLALMYARVPRSAYSVASAIWNAAYDVGMAVGAIGVGALASATGFPIAFVLTAAAMVPALALARRT